MHYLFLLWSVFFPILCFISLKWEVGEHKRLCALAQFFFYRITNVSFFRKINSHGNRIKSK